MTRAIPVADLRKTAARIAAGLTCAALLSACGADGEPETPTRTDLQPSVLRSL